MTEVRPIHKLIDKHGRRIRKLRVSLLDSCNFRCFYCMPLNPEFMPSSKWLQAVEIEKLCSALTALGLEEIRVTGGEPTLRREFRDILNRLSGLPLKKLGLTTNGFRLADELDFLKTTNCNNINISLDSLNPETFKKITRSDYFDTVMNSIFAAKERGFVVKINTVLMKGLNDHEILDFVEFSSQHEIEVRFLELMKIGQACGIQDELFISAETAIKLIRPEFDLERLHTEVDSTSYNFRTPTGARIGFIASETQSFCANCSRWRLTANGYLRACLMSSKGINFKDTPIENYKTQLEHLLTLKPYKRIEQVNEDMYQIGG